MAFEGMDPTVIRDVATTFDNQARTLDDVIAAPQGTVTRAQQSWRGADQGRFTSSWSAQHKVSAAGCAFTEDLPAT